MESSKLCPDGNGPFCKPPSTLCPSAWCWEVPTVLGVSLETLPWASRCRQIRLCLGGRLGKHLAVTVTNKNLDSAQSLCLKETRLFQALPPIFPEEWEPVEWGDIKWPSPGSQHPSVDPLRISWATYRFSYDTEAQGIPHRIGIIPGGC